MPFLFITRIIHTYLIDYPVAIVLMVAPCRLKLGKGSPVALWFWVAARFTALLLPTLTKRATGLVQLISYWLHTSADGGLGITSITARTVFHFTALEVWYYWVLTAAVLLMTLVLRTPEMSAAQRANLDMRNTI
ncbi:hypothetical protein XH99_29175 [Bradyrhizobium nanningense]|uniref:Uncharacterized protein n=1 Tax=Bradyrhizobium nanningense TaxID=1325118 RepID=A0A4Q0RZP1_9BRAD|nr:hypothetical protein [Bradyrhizobium nanningense]RXH24152.1 hypothetical protein XH99_29175 [Bradyrhizobium nanningense]RXH29291.1 hypothetical protein XH84_22615 [Bradyrhizobium nanningense]